MQKPKIISFSQLEWQPHPTIHGVDVKQVLTTSPRDVVLAKVEPGNEIPWHVHEDTTEVAYMLQGRGLLRTSASESFEPFDEIEAIAGECMIIPVGLWHSLQNLTTETIEIFALHT